MVLDKKQIENRIAEYLEKRDEVLFAYIFGSFVEKEYYHDVDVAAYLFDDFDRSDFKKFPYGYESGLISELNLLVREKIDFILMNNAEFTFLKRVIDHGVLLFSKDERKRTYYESYIRKMYIDTAHLRKIRRYYLAEKIINA
ncbi:MAG: nucleotidyltransferase domain-containing protein [Ignavibacteria bacterium]|jgi:predicted nucleotidyltransferase